MLSIPTPLSTDSREKYYSIGHPPCASITAVVQALERDRQDLLIAANRDLLEFGVALARKVTGCVARLDRQAAVANVEQALRLVGGQADVSVRIHPLDAETLRCFAGELSRGLEAARHINLVEDDSVSPGGAVVTAGPPSGGEVDARIETQLEQITALLLGTQTEVRSEKRGTLADS